jgi:hypothetical protein
VVADVAAPGAEAAPPRVDQPPSNLAAALYEQGELEAASRTTSGPWRSGRERSAPIIASLWSRSLSQPAARVLHCVAGLRLTAQPLRSSVQALSRSWGLDRRYTLGKNSRLVAMPVVQAGLNGKEG